MIGNLETLLAPRRGAEIDCVRLPVVSLRSTTGYKLASRRDADTGKFASLSQISSSDFGLSAVPDARGIKACSRWLSNATPPEHKSHAFPVPDARGIKAGSRWLSGATPPEPRIRFIRTPAGVPALRAA